MTTVNLWCGGVTSSTARISAKVTGTANIRVAYATNPELSNPEFSDAIATVNSAAIVDIAGMPSDTPHWYAIEDNGVLDTTPSKIGSFTTHPPVGSQASYSIIAWGDAGQTPEYPGEGAVLASARMSNHPAFDTMRTHASNPLATLCLGDICYYDPGSGVHVPDSSLTTYRRLWDDVLLQSRQQALYLARQLIHIWDDHEFGPNDSDKTSPGRNNACQVHRERVPSYPLPAASGPIYHAFQIGRVLWVVWDTRADRSPNTDPDDNSKTMLGAAQKAWLASLLATSTAEALVVVNPTPWLGVNDDAWSSYTTERTELVNLFSSTGWANRMCMVSADVHALGLVSAAGNAHGGWPIFHFAAIDAAPSTATGSQYDLGFQGGRNQYGVLTVTDKGDQITITGTGYVGTSVWRSNSLTVDLAEAPATAPAPVGEAAPRTSVTWLGCDLVTGKIIAELPDLDGDYGRVLGAYTSSGLKMPIPLTGPGALGDVAFQATEPGRTMLVPVINDLPSWGGIVLTRVGGTEATLDLGCVSLEGYLDRRYVRDHAWTAHDEASVIAAGLLADANVAGIGLVIDAPATGKLRNRVYHDQDDLTVYSQLRELMGILDGPEWTIDLDWLDASQTGVAKIARVRKRIGVASPAPSAVFETTASSVFSSRGSSEATYSYSEDYSDGKGANYVTATAAGEGESRPQSDPATSIQSGWPRYERRFAPSTANKTTAVLNEHATAELARRIFGSSVWQVSTRWDAYPQLNLDWALGDDVAWQLVGHRHPAGVTGQGRVIGWAKNGGLVRPILLEPGAEVAPIDEEKLVKSDTVTGTPNSSGYLTVTHNAGFTPAAVQVIGEAPISGSGIPVGLMVDTITDTKFRVRCLDQNGAAINSQVTLRWTAVEG